MILYSSVFGFEKTNYLTHCAVGCPSDILLRKLKEGTDIISIDNKVGGAGLTALNILKTPSNNTVLFILLSILIENDFEDYVPMFPVFSSDLMMATASGNKTNNIHDFLKDVKETNKPINAGVVFFSDRNALMLLWNHYNIPLQNLNMVPYKTGSLIPIDIQNNNLNVGVGVMTFYDGLIKRKLIDPVLLISRNRNPSYPMVPSLGEIIGKDNVPVPMIVAVLPINTPNNVREFHIATFKTLLTNDVKNAITKVNSSIVFLPQNTEDVRLLYNQQKKINEKAKKLSENLN